MSIQSWSKRGGRVFLLSVALCVISAVAQAAPTYFVSSDIGQNNLAKRNLVDAQDAFWETALSSAGARRYDVSLGAAGVAVSPISAQHVIGPAANGTCVRISGRDMNGPAFGTLTAATGSDPQLSDSNTLQGSAPRPTALYNTATQPVFWNGLFGASGSRNAILFEFLGSSGGVCNAVPKPTSGFGAWFGDVETSSGGRHAEVVTFAGATEVSRRNLSDSDDISTSCTASTLNCGNGTTRWVSFWDAVDPTVTSMLVVVGDNNTGGNGNDVAMSFIGPAIADAMPLLTLKKVTTTYFGGAFGFTLGNTVQASGSVSTLATGTPVQVDGDISQAGAQSFSVTAIGSDIVIQESSRPAGWTLTGASCTNRAGAAVGALVGDTLTIPAAQVTLSERFNCTFTNNAPPPPYANIGVVKTLTSAAGANPAIYSIVVTNAGTAPGTYALNDTPLLGSGIAALAPTCTNTSGGGVGDLTPNCAGTSGPWALADSGTPIGAGATHSYTVSVPYNVTSNATGAPGSGACPLTAPTTSPGGVNNAVSVIPSEGAVAVSNACSALSPLPPTLTLSKAVASPAGANPVRYTITVSNTGGPGTYSVNDSPLPGSGVTLGAARCQSSQNTSACTAAGAALSGSGPWVLAPAGTAIGAGVTHSFSLEQAYTTGGTLANTVGSALCPVSEPIIESGGLNNVATLSPSAGAVSRANACSAVAVPNSDSISAVPSMSQWAIILLIVLMGATGFWYPAFARVELSSAARASKH